jgi:hypothetical protein
MRRLIKYLVLILLLVIPNFAFSIQHGISKRTLGYYWGAQMNWGPYRTYSSLYFNFLRNDPIEVMNPKQEYRVFTRLLEKIYAPHYFLLQGTIYPAATMSSFIETDNPRFFKRFKTYFDLNLLRAVGGGYEEPYAVSVFLGNLIFFSRENILDTLTCTERRQTGSALGGFLISGGQWHIQDNIRIADWWYEIMLMLGGSLNETSIRRIEWNFRTGLKFHQNPLPADVAVVTIQRDHSEWKYRGWSLKRNSSFKYICHFPIGKDARHLPFTSRHYFIFSKKYPLPKPIFGINFLFKFGLGVDWEYIKEFDRQPRTFNSQETSSLSWVIQPNIDVDF